MFDGGISKWSGLLEMALESGHVVKPSNGWYSRVDLSTGVIEDKKWRIKDTDSKEFWMQVLTDKSFQDWVVKNYQVSAGSIMQNMDDDEIEKELAKIDD
jgi:hypothetical protein